MMIIYQYKANSLYSDRPNDRDPALLIVIDAGARWTDLKWLGFKKKYVESAKFDFYHKSQDCWVKELKSWDEYCGLKDSLTRMARKYEVAA